MPSPEARLSSNILQGSILPRWGKEPQSWAPLPHSQQTEGNPDFDILWSIFLFLNSSLSKDRFTAAWILRILWRAVMPLLLVRTAKRRTRGVYCSCSAPQCFSFKPAEGSDSHSRCFPYKMVKRGRQRKMTIRKCLFLLSTTLPLCHGSPSPP